MGVIVEIDLSEKKVLVVGGSKIALRRIGKIIDECGNLTVVAASVIPRIKEFDIEILEREFEISDLDKKNYVIAATDDCQLNSNIYMECKKRNILCNTVNKGSKSDFNFLATENILDIKLAVSTSGKNPSYGKALLKYLMNKITDNHIKIFNENTKLREEIVNKKLKDSEKRKIIKDNLYENNNWK